MNESRPIPHTRLPSVDRVLRTDAGVAATARFGHKATVGAVRRTLSDLRKAVRGGSAAQADAAAIAGEAVRLLEREDAPSLRCVFNLTGTVLHTNLGGGARGERDDHVRGLLRELTGAQDACLVNNNAGAVLLVLNTFGAGRDAVVSRGELIEIGGSFRLPDI